MAVEMYVWAPVYKICVAKYHIHPLLRQSVVLPAACMVGLAVIRVNLFLKMYTNAVTISEVQVPLSMRVSVSTALPVPKISPLIIHKQR